MLVYQTRGQRKRCRIFQSSKSAGREIFEIEETLSEYLQQTRVCCVDDTLSRHWDPFDTVERPAVVVGVVLNRVRDDH